MRKEGYAPDHARKSDRAGSQGVLGNSSPTERHELSVEGTHLKESALPETTEVPGLLPSKLKTSWRKSASDLKQQQKEAELQ